MKKATRKYIHEFNKQVNKSNYTLITKDNLYIATGNNIYITLEFKLQEVVIENVLAVEFTVIIGDYKKALEDGILNPVSEEKIIILENDFYNSYSEDPVHTINKDTIKKLKPFIGLNSRIYKNSEYTFFQQIGNHDLILKDPLPIQVIRGKAEITQVIEQLKQINLPNGWLIQKSKGIGKKSNVKIYKNLIIITIIIMIIIRAIIAIGRLF
ncbi:hypothetical protein [Algibacter lectus]|uniref:hypothetical protein n=1 Tax=Algibacter lectus TaxID=221126 RepID=UPI0026EAE54F|nr:hypothetical protein [Algibacter lectus]MDO7136744.1 hypothetical protein [Algibacter lectus]